MNHAYDVVVVGAGSAGCCAAIASARTGARTLLVDRLGFPGGTSTAVLDTFYAFYTAGAAGRKVVSGLPDEPVEHLRERRCLIERPNTFGSGLGYTYNPEELKLVWTEMLVAAGVDVALHTVLVAAECTTGGVVKGVTLAGRSGLFLATASTYIDASGDADLVLRAGGLFQDDGESRQPATLTFRMCGVDIDRFRDEGRPRFRQLVEVARERGFDLRGNGGSLHESGAPGTVLVSTTRAAAPDYTDPLAPGRLELDGLQQVEVWRQFLRQLVPGFAYAELSAIGAMSGVRETRRVLGRATLMEEQVMAGHHPEDEICRCGAPIEDLSGLDTRWAHVGGAGDYGVPWGALLPRGLPNVVVAGRCLSATHAAHASARSMGTCMAMGQAAGTAASMAVQASIRVAEIDVRELQDRLVHDGADILGISSATDQPAH